MLRVCLEGLVLDAARRQLRDPMAGRSVGRERSEVRSQRRSAASEMSGNRFRGWQPVRDPCSRLSQPQPTEFRGISSCDGHLRQRFDRTRLHPDGLGAAMAAIAPTCARPTGAAHRSNSGPEQSIAQLASSFGCSQASRVSHAARGAAAFWQLFSDHPSPLTSQRCRSASPLERDWLRMLQDISGTCLEKAPASCEQICDYTIVVQGHQ